jgi:hypothetical protein
MSENNDTVTPPKPAEPAEIPAPPALQSVAEPSVGGDGEPAGPHPTTRVSVRPRLRRAGRGPLTRMGPWAPVAGAALGLALGVVVVLLLAGSADTFEQRLALVFVVVGLGMLGASATLLGDEVRMVRRGVGEAAVRPAWVEATAGLLSGLTPARLLLLASAFVLFLSAYVGRG